MKKYIYKMSRDMYWATVFDAERCGMSITEYVTRYFGIIGECIKVEII